MDGAVKAQLHEMGVPGDEEHLRHLITAFLRLGVRYALLTGAPAAVVAGLFMRALDDVRYDLATKGGAAPVEIAPKAIESA